MDERKRGELLEVRFALANGQRLCERLRRVGIVDAAEVDASVVQRALCEWPLYASPPGSRLIATLEPATLPVAAAWLCDVLMPHAGLLLREMERAGFGSGIGFAQVGQEGLLRAITLLARETGECEATRPSGAFGRWASIGSVGAGSADGLFDGEAYEQP